METTENKKTKTQLLKDLQIIVDEFNKKKELVEILMDEIDDLENNYHSIVKKIKNK